MVLKSKLKPSIFLLKATKILVILDFLDLKITCIIDFSISYLILGCLSLIVLFGVLKSNLHIEALSHFFRTLSILLTHLIEVHI